MPWGLPRLWFPRGLSRCSSVQSADAVGYVRLLFAFGIFLNVPFLVAPRLLHVSARGLVNVEYLAVGAMACLLPRVPAFAALALVVACDIGERSFFVFYFSQRDLASSLRYLSLLPLDQSLWMAAALVSAALVLSWSAFQVAPAMREMSRGRTAASVTATLVLVCTVDIAAGTNDLVHLTERRIPLNIASAPAFSVVRALYDAYTRKSMVVGPAAESASHPLLSLLKDPASRLPSNPHIVLVLVESYGQLLDDVAASALAASYNRAELKSRYRLETGVVRFRGGTVSGELRELCGMSADLSAVPLAENLTTGCLPALLQKRGYGSTAIHGYVGEMFGRDRWYPSLGFRESLFREDLEKQREIHDCRGFFPGACDADVARFTHSLLLAHPESPQFIYWVTLNSHLPVPSSITVGQNLDCDANGIHDRDVCLWARLIFNVNQTIAEIASDPAIGPTEFLVVGDHGPPFWRTTRRALFSQTHVPYFRLVPRT